MRHDKVCVNLLSMESTRRRNDRQRALTHTHTHNPVCEHEDVTIVEQGVYRRRDRERVRDVRANSPDIIIKIKNEETCIVTDMPILADGNVTQKEAEN
jgi:hypothetical protein